jgi:Zn-dependent protease with chaperone function
MTVFALVPILASVLLAGTGRALARRLAPAVAVPLLTALALAVSLATGAVLSLAAFVVLARQPALAAVGGWSRSTWRPWAGVPFGWGLLAAGLAAVLLAAAGGYLARAARELITARSACRRLADGSVAGLVILPGEQPAAYTVAGRPGSIVVSAGMLALLSPDERRALLAHEAAHLRRGHACFVVAARLAAAANPLLRPLARGVALAAELQADQDAAAEVGDRRIVAAALARASLATARRSRPATALAMAESEVATRVRALTGPPGRPRTWAAAAAAALTMACGLTAAGTVLATHQQVEVAQAAYLRAHSDVTHRPADRLARARYVQRRYGPPADDYRHGQRTGL